MSKAAWSSWELSPTGEQGRAISKLCIALREKEELEWLPRTRREARNMMFDLRRKLLRRR